MKASILYYILLTAACVTMGLSGYDVATWQYWVVAVCIIGAHLCGRERK